MTLPLSQRRLPRHAPARTHGRAGTVQRLLSALAPALLAGCTLHGLEMPVVARPAAVYAGAAAGPVRSALVVEMEERQYFLTWQTAETLQFERRFQEAGPTAWGNPAPDAVVVYTVSPVPSGVQVVADISAARRYGGLYTRADTTEPTAAAAQVRQVLAEVESRVGHATAGGTRR